MPNGRIQLQEAAWRPSGGLLEKPAIETRLKSNKRFNLLVDPLENVDHDLDGPNCNTVGTLTGSAASLSSPLYSITPNGCYFAVAMLVSMSSSLFPAF